MDCNEQLGASKFHAQSETAKSSAANERAREHLVESVAHRLLPSDGRTHCLTDGDEERQVKTSFDPRQTVRPLHFCPVRPQVQQEKLKGLCHDASFRWECQTD